MYNQASTCVCVECLMVALRSLANDGWRTHSLQQDGLLVERGERAGNAPAVPLYLPPDPVTLTPRGAIANAERAIEMAKGVRIGLLKKPSTIAQRYRPSSRALPCPAPTL